LKLVAEEAGMWDLLTKQRDECSHFRDVLEDSAAARPRPLSVGELLEVLPQAQRTHFAVCRNCQDAARDLLAAGEVFKGMAPRAEEEEARPWFASRVMAAIAAREKELSEVASAWLAVPKFASRLALASGALLVVASTWLYERPYKVPAKPPTVAATQEYLFEAPQPPMNQDDVLISMAEKNQ
jgi:hypothetical protein